MFEKTNMYGNSSQICTYSFKGAELCPNNFVNNDEVKELSIIPAF